MSRRMSHSRFVFIVMALLLWASDAHAQMAGDLSRFNDLANSVITVVQGLALLGGVIGFVRVGVMYYQGDDRAPASLKNAGIGTAMVAGATIIMEFIKRAIFVGI